jgi:uncharacterized protein (DUF1778 family)
MSITSLQASMSDIGGLAARGMERQMIQPSFLPQTSYGMMAQFNSMFHQLAEQLRRAERDVRDDEAAVGDGTDDGPRDHSRIDRLQDLIGEATVILGHKIPTKDMNTFNQMVQDGYIASVTQLLEAMEVHRLDDQVYQAFLDRLHRSQEGQISLKRDADGSEQWQVRGLQLDGHDVRALEMRRYDPEDRDSFGQGLDHIR